MARLLNTSSDISGPKSATGPALRGVTEGRSYPSHLYREQFWWRSDGEPIAPEIDGIFPQSAQAGGSDLRLYVHGTGFTGESKIWFNDNEEPTTMHSNGVLSTGVRAGMFTVPAVVPVQVKTGSAESNILNFEFVAGPVPEGQTIVITDVQPDNYSGTGAQMVGIFGDNLTPTCKAFFDDVEQDTAAGGDPLSLEVNFTAEDWPVDHVIQVVVKDGEAFSNTLTLTRTA